MNEDLYRCQQPPGLRLRNITRIKRYIDKGALHHVVGAFFLSRLDLWITMFYNVVLYHKELDEFKLQSAAHLVCLKTLDTIGTCPRPVFSLGVPQHML